MKEKILLINSSGTKGIIYFPLGLGYIAGSLSREGIEVECLDMNISDLSDEEVINKIQKEDFHVIGIGGFIMQLKSTIKLVNMIKKECKDVFVVLGGVQVLGCEDYIVNNSQVDVICIGEAESTLPQVVHTLYSGKDITNVGIPAILIKRRGIIIRKGGSSLEENIDLISFPKYEAFEMEAYINSNYHKMAGKRTIDFICSRGCPYKCNFCINSKKSVKVRYRTPENALKEIRFLKARYNINDFSFCDEIFTVNRNKALEICEAIKNEKITWLTSCRADGLDVEMVKAMKEAGCCRLLIGFESGSEKILKTMNKKIDKKVYANAIRLLRDNDIQIYANFMIGMPGESSETVLETQDFCIENDLIFGPSFVTPFPGTRLYDDIRHKIADEGKYLASISEIDYGKNPVINLTNLPLWKLIFLKNRTVVNTNAHIIHKKMRFSPIFFIKMAFWAKLEMIFIKNRLKEIVSMIVKGRRQ